MNGIYKCIIIMVNSKKLRCIHLKDLDSVLKMNVVYYM